jgi:hypothetical protein
MTLIAMQCWARRHPERGDQVLLPTQDPTAPLLLDVRWLAEPPPPPATPDAVLVLSGHLQARPGSTAPCLAIAAWTDWSSVWPSPTAAQHIQIVGHLTDGAVTAWRGGLPDRYEAQLCLGPERHLLVMADGVLAQQAAAEAPLQTLHATGRLAQERYLVRGRPRRRTWLAIGRWGTIAEACVHLV